MSLPLTIQVETRAVTDALAEMGRTLSRPRTMMEAAGKEVVQALKAHFRERQGEGNRKGWPSRRFWFGVKNSVANATAVDEVTDTSAIVAIASPAFAHKIKGGTVRPKEAKAIAIPLRAEAYRMGGQGSIREHSKGRDLFLLKTRRGAWLVRQKSKSRGRGKIRTTTLEFWFKLVGAVTHKPDPRALPEAREIAAAALRGAEKAVTLLTRKGRL